MPLLCLYKLIEAWLAFTTLWRLVSASSALNTRKGNMAGIFGVFGDWNECCPLTEKQRDLLALTTKISEEFNWEDVGVIDTAGAFENCKVLSENQIVKLEQALEAHKRCLSSYGRCQRFQHPFPYDRFYTPPFPYNRFYPSPFPYDRFSAPSFPYYRGSNKPYPFPYYGGSNKPYPFPYYGFPLGPSLRW